MQIEVTIWRVACFEGSPAEEVKGYLVTVGGSNRRHEKLLES
jgi:hypothetical protein